MKPMTLRPALFWDTDPKKIDLKKHARYVIERVADFGRDKEARWVLDNYDKKLIRETIKKSRGIQPQTRALWMLLSK